MSYKVRDAGEGWLYIGHPFHPGLVWSHEGGGWVGVNVFARPRQWPPALFANEDELEDYATEFYLYPRID